MMHYSIYSKYFKAENKEIYESLFQNLEKYGARYSVNPSIALGLQEWDAKYADLDVYPEYQLPENTRALICLGGDGTILSAMLGTLYREVPILGINLGQLGFMAEVVASDLEQAIKMLVDENYSLDPRMALELESDNQLFGDYNFGLNEFTLHKRDTSSIIKIRTYLNGELLTTYWTDGLIVSTPTGSTGYNLSCGGPIVFPNSDNFIITPIAPHHLNVRPVVVSSDYTLSFVIEGRGDTALCTIDSRNEVISMSQEIALKKHPKKVLLMKFPETNFLQILHSKLQWGQDTRNKVLS